MALVFSDLIHATPSTSIFFSFCHAALWQRQEVLTVAALCYLLSFLLLYLWGRAQRLTCTGDSTCSTLLYLEFFYLSPSASASQRRCSAEQRAEFERKGVNRTTSVHLATDSLRFWNSAEARCSCVKSSQGVFGIEMCQRSFPAQQTIRWPLLTYGRGL